MKFTHLLFALTIGMALLPPARVAPAFASTDDVCGNPKGRYFQPDTFPRFEAANQRLVLISWNTGKVVQVIEDGARSIDLLEWSPDCRYLVGAVLTNHNSEHPVDGFVWDIPANRRVAIFPQVYPYYIAWDDTERYVIVNGSGATYLWDLAGPTQVKLTDRECPFDQYYFDYARRQLLGIFIQCFGSSLSDRYTDSSISEFSLQTGQLIKRYGENSPIYHSATFAVSPDGRKLVLNGIHDGYFAVIDRASGQATELNTDMVPGQFVFSPDNRYLAAGFTVIRVWDLAHLAPKAADRTPLYSIPLDGNFDWHFLDATTIDINNGSQHKTFNLTTGKFN